MFSGRKKPDFCDKVNYQEAVERLSRNDAAAKRQKIAEEFKTTGNEEKPELMSFLSSLPDVEEDHDDEGIEDSFRDSDVSEDLGQGAQDGQENQVNSGEMEEEKETPGETLAKYIRIRTQGEKLTSLKSLKEEIDQVELLVELMEKEESCQDIKREVCDEDVYFYSERYMTANYAMIAALIDHNDLPMMFARITRFNCKRYPTPTPLMYFERHPYNLTQQQILRAVDQMSRKEEYKDIQTVVNNENKKFLYSIDIMSTRYAKSLVDVDLFAD